MAVMASTKKQQQHALNPHDIAGRQEEVIFCQFVEDFLNKACSMQKLNNSEADKD